MRKALQVPECQIGTCGYIPIPLLSRVLRSLSLKEKQSLEHCHFLVHLELEGIHVKPFSCTCSLLDRQVQLLLDSLYVDSVGVLELTRSVF